MTTKAFTVWQAHWVDVLSQYNFLIIYRPGATNCANTLIKRKQDLNDQTTAKISLLTQVLLQPKHFDPQIQAELNTNSLGTEICPVDSSKFNFINELLQANYTAPSLQKHCEKAKNIASLYSFKNGLLKH